MDVLVDCEESQAVTIAFRNKGHNAYSCDLLSCSGGHSEWHIQGDAIDTLRSKKWDLVIAHPPCTRLANSGVRWLKERDLWHDLAKAIYFFKQFQEYQKETGIPMCIENPIPHKYAVDGFDLNGKFIEGIGKYSQIIQPWQFGHGEQKATCLWLYNLPDLIPTNIVEGREQRIWKMQPGEDRAKERSKTFVGIAEAFAAQWG